LLEAMAATTFIIFAAVYTFPWSLFWLGIWLVK
jgi:hypothetical protein